MPEFYNSQNYLRFNKLKKSNREDCSKPKEIEPACPRRGRCCTCSKCMQCLQGENVCAGPQGKRDCPCQQDEMNCSCLQSERGCFCPQEEGDCCPQEDCICSQNERERECPCLQETEGCPGPRGPRGNRGPVGPQGQEGPAGPEGQIGPKGPQGPVGPEGPQGQEGPAGPKGPQGPMGCKGCQGPQGEQGPQGIPGIPGEIGPMGPTGPAGIGSTVFVATNAPKTLSIHRQNHIQIGVIMGNANSYDGIQLAAEYLDNKVKDKISNCSMLILHNSYITDLGVCFYLSDSNLKITESFVMFAQIWASEDNCNYFKPIKGAVVRTPVYAGTDFLNHCALETVTLNQPVFVKAGTRLLYVVGMDASDASKEVQIVTSINGSFALRQL